MALLSRAARQGFNPERSAGLAVPRDKGIARLHVGDPCFATPKHIVEAAHAAMLDGFTHYPPAQGDPELRAAIARRASARSGRAVDPSEVLVTGGTTAAIFCALSTVVDPGDEVLLFDPSYSLYVSVINQIGGRPVYVGMDGAMRPNLGRLRRAITNRTRALVINNPVNPTGVIMRANEIEGIAELGAERDLFVLSDEIYDELTYGGTFRSTLAIPKLADRLLYVNGFSKTFAMTGWRLGYLIAPPAIIQGALTIHSNAQGGVNWPTQRAGIAALEGPRQPVEEMIAGYQTRREALLEALDGTPGLDVIPPEGTFYLYVRYAFDRPLESAELTKRLLAEGVAVRSGTEYGPSGEGHLRISYSASLDDIHRGAERLRRVFEAQAGG